MDRLIRNYMTTLNESTSSNEEELKEITSSIIQCLKNNQGTLLSVVQQLGDFLTSEDATFRSKGVNLLSAILIECPRELVNQTVVNVLVEFYCERLSDTESVPELVKGLYALSQFETFGDENSIRNIFYIICSKLSSNDKTLSLKQIESEFIAGFIQVMDGEKDPRNLLLAFFLVKSIIREFDISNNIEALFEVIFCYFPITFKPPLDDPYGITAEDLKIALRECLSSTPYFGKSAMPLLIEKLSSSSGNAKKDSMETIAVCAPVYGANSLIEFLDVLWDENIALDTIRSIVYTLSMEVVEKSEHLKEFLKIIVDECMENIERPELKLAKPSGIILKHCLMASDPSYNLIISATLSKLLLKYSQYLYGTIYEPKFDSDYDFTTPLISYKDELLEIFSSALLSINEYNELRSIGVNGIYNMILLDKFLSDDEISILLQYYNQIILNELDQELFDETLKLLSDISKYKSNLILEITLPIILDKLPNNENDLITNNIHYDDKLYIRLLKALSELSIQPILFENYLPNILKTINNLDVDPISSIEIVNDYLESLLNSLLMVLTKKTQLNYKESINYHEIIIKNLLLKCIQPTLSSEEKHENLYFNLNIIKIIGDILSLLIRNLNVSEQTLMVNEIFNLFTKGSLDYINYSNKESLTFNPLSIESNVTQQNLILLFTSIVGSIKPKAKLPLENISEFLSNMQNLILSTTNKIQQNSLCQLFACIINKWENENELNNYVKENVLENLMNHITINYNNINDNVGNTREISLNLFLWISKALILRTNELGYECVNCIIKLFNDESLAKKASNGFEILIGESETLNKEAFVIIKLLYKQKFFNFSVTKLVEGFKISNEVRISALQCLGLLPDKLAFDILFPFKNKIIRELSFVLDDKKRLVRRAAVDCRSKWF
ncbi:11976_t:CDS:10 [Entrophospora sp. SA101]|nr:11976_t:CDS:10 [Entrophospora sp. SA101]